MRPFLFCTVLSATLLSSCVSTHRTRVTGIKRIDMRNASAFVFVTFDHATGEFRPRDFFADNVIILHDVPFDEVPWAEYVDRPGELSGEGDTLIIHVRSLSDIE